MGVESLGSEIAISMDTCELKQLLKDSGFEIYAAEGAHVHLAERVRVHLMDAGVVVVAGDPIEVSFVVRSEAASAASLTVEEHHDRIRKSVASTHAAAGFIEVEACCRRIEDPGDPSRTLDYWYEVRFGASVSPEQLAERLRYCLSRVKCVVS